MVGVALVVVTALALGLGLGLGLSNGSSAPVPAAQCYSSETLSKIPKTKAEWKPKLPAECPGQLACPAGKKDPTLLVLSMDGFRADYLLRNMTPTLDFLSRCGVHAPYMRAVFPTKTFPNHYTLATGMYPESHGIIDNNFYDPVYKEVFSYGGANTSDYRWWGGEPIWNTAKKAGKKVASMMWPGSDVNIQNMRPDICYNYHMSFSLDDRVTEVLSWFDGDPATFPDLVMLYFEQPDSAGHAQGPFGDYVLGNLTYVDGLVNRLLDGFIQRNMFNCLNFIVLADHGMEGIDCKRTVDISKYIDTSPYYVYQGVHSRMTSRYTYAKKKKGAKSTVIENPNPVPVDETLSKLTCLYHNNTRDWYVRVHKKQDLPRRYHYINNRCIDEIVMDIEEDYYLGDFRVSPCSIGGGSHGADNTYKSMHTIFIGSGPSFPRGSVVESFENIEVYNLFCEILGLSASANNGTYGLLSPMLRSYKPTNDVNQLSYSDGDRCPFPEELAERENRRNSSDCVSTPPSCLGSKTVEQVDSRLNLTSVEASDVVHRILPLGVPSNADSDVCILVQADYVSGYSSKFQMPLWTAFTFTPASKSAILDAQYRTDSAYESCARADVRLAGGIDCSSYYNDSIKIAGSLLFPPGLASSNESMTDGFLSTNLVPMYENFRAGIWKEMLHLFEEYSAKYGQLQVVLGPVFDYNADGLNDSVSELREFTRGSGSVPIPSHYFAIATFCNSTSQTPSDCVNATRVLTFVLPHTQTDVNCRDQLPVPDVYLRQNTARARDVEWLTGLTLFGDVGNSFYRSKLLTYLTEDLWPKLSWMDVDGDCPDLSNTNCPANYGSPPLLLISLDGFRPDYLKKKLSPILERLNRCGVSAPYMKSIYPTLTFPNHHTISTGLYPETHGIIDNSMYDVKLNQSFYLGSPNALNPAWWFGEPIWNTLFKNGKHAMTCFWPGSDVEIGEMRPTEYVLYDGSMPYNVRVDTALKWLNGSAGVYPDLVVLYFSKVDEGGHEGGPGSLQVDEAIEAVDKALEQLMDGIYRLKLHTCVNMIVVSDHGMSDISCSRSVLVGDYLSAEILNKTYLYPGAAGRMSNKYRRSGNNYFHIPPEEQIPLQQIIDPLKCKSGNMIALDKHQMPRHHHYINQDRIDDVQLVMADTWLVDRTSPWCAIKGQHGWDPNYEVMKALFIGYGPDFLEKSDVEPFENIQLYNLMAHLTGVSAAQNNGTEGSLYHLLKTPPPLPLLLPGVTYQDCNFPADDEEYELRANLTNTGCQCSVSNSEIRTYDNRLNLTEAQQGQLEIVHVSHGNPAVLYDDSFCILHHSDFVSGFSHRLKMPVWTSFNLTATQVTKNETSIDCTRPDVRLSPDRQFSCLQYQKANENGTYPVFLFPPKWSSTAESATDSLLLSNQVPMKKSFITDVWDLAISYFANITKTAGNLQIVFGPIFDYDGDGLQDNITRLAEQSGLLIPSHYYAIALRCVNGACKDMNYDPLTFILPHWNNSRSENCQSIQPFLLQNVARIRDVELLTGLRFLTANPTQISIQRRVQIPEALWT